MDDSYVYIHMAMLAGKYKKPEVWVGALWEYLYRPSMIYIENRLREFNDDWSEEEYYTWLRKHFNERWLIRAESLCS